MSQWRCGTSLRASALLLVLGLVGTSALALPLNGLGEVPPTEIVLSFEAFDENGDGMIDRAEFAQWFEMGEDDADPFAFFDLDDDGLVSRAEFEAIEFEALG